MIFIGIDDRASFRRFAAAAVALAMAEFKVCPLTGRYWFIEVNPRLWGSLPLAVSAGVEFPYLAWLCAAQGIGAAAAYEAGCAIREQWRARWLLGDILAGSRDWLSRLRGKSAQTLQPIRADMLDDLYWDDPLVFPGEVIHYVLTALSNRSLNAAEKGMIG